MEFVEKGPDHPGFIMFGYQNRLQREKWEIKYQTSPVKDERHRSRRRLKKKKKKNNNRGT